MRTLCDVKVQIDEISEIPMEIGSFQEIEKTKG